jgi:hypothetical protein
MFEAMVIQLAYFVNLNLVLKFRPFDRHSSQDMQNVILQILTESRMQTPNRVS